MNMTLPIVAGLAFDPLTFFDGCVKASGMVVDLRGRITRRYTARFDGKRQGDVIAIDEKLIYEDGAADQRHWQIRLTKPGCWIAVADGLVTDAVIQCDAADPAQSRWTYMMDIPVRGRKLRFAMEDIMTLVEPNRMLALTPMKKFGIKFAHITSEYRRIAA
jgi:hypothetical protein